MCKYSREMFFSNYILFTCTLVSTDKKKPRVMFPWDLYWENKTYKLKRAVDRPMVIWISESGKHFLVESVIQEFGFVESRIVGLGI